MTITCQTMSLCQCLIWTTRACRKTSVTKEDVGLSSVDYDKRVTHSTRAVTDDLMYLFAHSENSTLPFEVSHSVFAKCLKAKRTGLLSDAFLQGRDVCLRALQFVFEPPTCVSTSAHIRLRSYEL